MKEQHKEMLRRLKAGEFDSAAFCPRSRPLPKKRPRLPRRHPRILPRHLTHPSRKDFPQQNQSLDEIILDYLVTGEKTDSRLNSNLKGTVPVKERIDDLEEKARRLRVSIVKTLHKSQSGHTGGSLSAIDMVTALYFQKMRHDPEDPAWEGRDRFVLCKGHAAPAQYVALAEAGYFPAEDLMMLRRLGSHLQGHPDSKSPPGSKSAPALSARGFPWPTAWRSACGLTAAEPGLRALGDGELQEGQVWEAAMAAGHYRLDNLCALVDANGLQIDGDVEKVMNVAPSPTSSGPSAGTCWRSTAMT